MCCMYLPLVPQERENKLLWANINGNAEVVTLFILVEDRSENGKKHSVTERWTVDRKIWYAVQVCIIEKVYVYKGDYGKEFQLFDYLFKSDVSAINLGLWVEQKAWSIIIITIVSTSHLTYLLNW